MKLLLVLLLLFVYADEESKYPLYKSKIKVLINKIETDLNPQKLRLELNSLINSKRSEIRNYEKKLKSELRDKHKAAERDLKSVQRSEYDKETDRIKRKALFQTHKGAKREMLDAHRKESDELKSNLKKQKQEFDDFIRSEKAHFDEKYNELRRKTSQQVRQKLNEKNPVLEEFKEMPKGPGIELTPLNKDK